MEKIKKTAGEAILGTIILTALITSAVSTTVGWLTTKMLNSPEQVAASIGLVKSDIDGIKTADAVRDIRISNLEGVVKDQKSDIEYIRRSMEEQNRRSGIVIK